LNSMKKILKHRPWLRGTMALTILALNFAIAVTPAVSGDFTSRKPTQAELAGITETIGRVFRGWGNLDLDLYMSAWSVNARQYLKNGVKRNYNEILSHRRSAFKKYREVHFFWEIHDCDIDSNKAYVSCFYEMTFVKVDGSSFNEGDEEYYVLEYMPDGRWLIIENYDYLLKR